MSLMFVTRFAPSPTGYLHVGHAFSALTAARAAKAADGRFLLRIEDIDQGRCRPEFESAIYEDLDWLGLDWETPVRRQSEHFADYARALQRLIDEGLVYRCFKTRKEVLDDIARAPHLASTGPEGPPFVGTPLPESEESALLASGAPFAWRLSMAAARARLGAEFDALTFRVEPIERVSPLSRAEPSLGVSQVNRGRGVGGEGASPEAKHQQPSPPTPLPHQRAGEGGARGDRCTDDAGEQDVTARPEMFGDAVIARKDAGTSYHLASVHDDALQGVTHVIRGEDLASAAHLHRLLQALLGYSTPIYRHHRLLTDETGRRLAKRDKAATLRSLRKQGLAPDEVPALRAFY